MVRPVCHTHLGSPKLFLPLNDFGCGVSDILEGIPRIHNEVRFGRDLVISIVAMVGQQDYAIGFLVCTP